MDKDIATTLEHLDSLEREAKQVKEDITEYLIKERMFSFFSVNWSRLRRSNGLPRKVRG